MNFKSFLFAFLFLGAFVFSACEKDKDSDPDNEQELITTIRLSFTGGGSTVTFNATDKDGDGGLAPVIDKIALKPNTDYALKVAFLDESKTPSADITEEVGKESDVHLVCLTGSGSMPSPTTLDKDKNNKPLGLSSSFKTGAAGAGTLKVTLKHEPDKNNANPCSTGETDAEATFTVEVK
ncbi:MAG: hypothetical protein IPH16_07610 [Haliscomenobacter sp.]|nr:hypothetical protein [Haliscomenobacter sp.]MBK7475819.1 hypothetical protein [Haliscomenobacter sp.]MBK8879273.1 hypothetical protein [Haliscomenobacter sp.]